MKINKKDGSSIIIRDISFLELEPKDIIPIIIPASNGISKICFTIGFTGKLVIKGDKSLIEFRKSFY
jgi:hypothetical protein